MHEFTTKYMSLKIKIYLVEIHSAFDIVLKYRLTNSFFNHITGIYESLINCSVKIRINPIFNILCRPKEFRPF